MTQQPSVYLQEEPSPLQQTLYNLETLKRRTGRKFDKATVHKERVELFNLYNNTENEIRRLCAEHNLHRNSKPYKLSLDKV